MSTAAAYPVYTGFWTDWSKGQLMGATLTLTNRGAQFLSAFIVFALTVITTRLWAIISFAVHSALSTSDVRDTLHHQRQALLRNNGGPTGTAWTLTRMACKWRKNPKAFRRILPLLLTTALVAAGFSVAAIFSSRVTLGSGVLIDGQGCVLLKETTGSTNGSEVSWYSTKLTEGANFAHQCYPTNQSTLSSLCTNHPYIRQYLPFSINTTASCPFAPELCATQTENLLLDTGLIDTDADLGINAPPDDRLQYRTTAHCAPLVVNGYSDIVQVPGNNSFTRYFYGPKSYSNVTLEYPSSSNSINLFRYLHGDANWVFQDYSISPKLASVTNGSSDGGNFKPIPGLMKTPGDILLVFLSPNEIKYRQPTEDLWYNSSRTSRTRKANYGGLTDNFTMTLWYPVEPASPLGCLHAHQWCIPNAGCTKLGSYGDWTPELTSVLKLSNSTLHRLDWFISTTSPWTGFSGLLGSLGSQVLTVRPSLENGLQGPIADDQWQQDVIFWMSSMLATIQESFLTSAIGAYPDVEEDVVYPNTPEAQAVCSNTKIISPDHTSFSAFGLAFMLVTGLLIIITSFVLEPITRCAQRRFKLNPYSRLEWLSTSVFQLQRLAHEELGLGTWVECNTDLPTTAPGTMLAVLDISDETHPVLRAPNAKKAPSPNTDADGEVSPDNHPREDGTDSPASDRSVTLTGASPTIGRDRDSAQNEIRSQNQESTVWGQDTAPAGSTAGPESSSTAPVAPARSQSPGNLDNFQHPSSLVAQGLSQIAEPSTSQAAAAILPIPVSPHVASTQDAGTPTRLY